MASSSSPHINFVKASYDSTPSSYKPLETKTFKAKRSHVSNEKVKPHKIQPHLTQRAKSQAKRPQPRHVYMYTRYNTPKHTTQSPHNIH